MHTRSEDPVSLKNKVARYAFQTFMRLGIRTVKMDDIAAAFSMSKRTLYELFDDKENLLVAGLMLFVEDVRESYEKVRKESDNLLQAYLKWHFIYVKRVRYASHAFLSDVRQYDKVRQYYESEQQRRDTAKREFLQQGVAEGLFRTDINYSLFQLIVDLAEEKTNYMELHKQYSYEDFFHSVLLVQLRGICTEKGLQVLNDNLDRMNEIDVVSSLSSGKKI